MYHKPFICLFAFLFLLFNLSYGQAGPAVLKRAIKANVIDSLDNALLANYIYPDTAALMMQRIRGKLKAGAYDPVTNAADYAKYLTADLRAIYNDKHLTINYDPVANDTEHNSYIQQVVKQMRAAEQARQQNYGFSKLEILSGNIGYVALNGFFELNDQSKRAVNAAFDLLINTDALVIDLRLNGGGQADMVHYISSFLFKDPTHINSFYIRRGNEFHQNRTEPLAQSQVFGAIPVYILVSGYTVSAAEEFTYNLQSLHRAIVVGQVTNGAAHPMQKVSIGNGFTANIPFARPINPITKTDWEGRGIKPDIPVDTNDALNAAIQNFYQQQICSTDTLIAKRARWLYFIYKAKQQPCKMTIRQLKAFTGNYGDNKITMKNGQLIYHTSNGYAVALNPISAKTFTLNASLDNRELVFIKNALGYTYKMYLNFNGSVSAIFIKNEK